MKQLLRSRRDRVFAGVCGGIGEYFEIDSNLVRLVWILISLTGVVPGILLYLLAWVILPEDDNGEP
ncbi:PspC domain-containing protein [Methanosphaerula palustris]|uniref:Phage shock protein C, PspC n=1 Tax=Methanosphaerula palustris (strain ATCC BAA-1556 / DSM 19958 / E1-9c) TaxID=521011 RepID=B8GEJ9_METPE|nr:PspC domain-containing protein [Methanosphaerula palustris]ACL17700.1 phage shock protein C, PspC [Methanosphaerula palustris E1-9c]